jgi:hypothetical protein
LRQCCSVRGVSMAACSSASLSCHHVASCSASICWARAMMWQRVAGPSRLPHTPECHPMVVRLRRGHAVSPRCSLERRGGLSLPRHQRLCHHHRRSPRGWHATTMIHCGSSPRTRRLRRFLRWKDPSGRSGWQRTLGSQRKSFAWGEADASPALAVGGDGELC